MNFWDQVLKRLEDRLSHQNFERWFASTLLLYTDDHRIIILVPDRPHSEGLVKFYDCMLRGVFIDLKKPDLALYCIHKTAPGVQILEPAGSESHEKTS
jgi:chromosomal replication initiation ATPase DnaA